MSDYSPVWGIDVELFTMTASATITGGQVLVVTGVGTVAPSAGASGVAVGVAAQDAVTNGRVSIWPLAGVTHETVTPAGVTAGASLASSTAGGVDSGVLGTLAAAGQLLGTATTTASAGLKCRWIGK